MHAYIHTYIHIYEREVHKLQEYHDQGNNKQKKGFLSLVVPKGESVAIMEGRMAPGRHDTVGVSKSLPLIHKHSTERKLTENHVGF